jgi:7-cyano-7-deazaguanine synthase in queuosine biosynthesis
MEINGKEIQLHLLEEMKLKIANLMEKGIVPCIAIVTLGPEETWEAYVGQKIKLAKKLDITTKIVNLQLKYQIVVDPDYNKQLIIQNINSKLKSFFDIKNFQIDQPLNYSEIRNVIFNNVGVISVQQVQFFNITGTQADVDKVVARVDRVFVVLNHQNSVAQVAQVDERLDESLIVTLMETDRRLVEHIERAHESAP